MYTEWRFERQQNKQQHSKVEQQYCNVFTVYYSILSFSQSRDICNRLFIHYIPMYRCMDTMRMQKTSLTTHQRVPVSKYICMYNCLYTSKRTIHVTVATAASSFFPSNLSAPGFNNTLGACVPSRRKDNAESSTSF